MDIYENTTIQEASWPNEGKKDIEYESQLSSREADREGQKYDADEEAGDGRATGAQAYSRLDFRRSPFGNGYPG